MSEGERISQIEVVIVSSSDLWREYFLKFNGLVNDIAVTDLKGMDRLGYGSVRKALEDLTNANGIKLLFYSSPQEPASDSSFRMEKNPLCLLVKRTQGIFDGTIFKGYYWCNATVKTLHKDTTGSAKG